MEECQPWEATGLTRHEIDTFQLLLSATRRNVTCATLSKSSAHSWYSCALGAIVCVALSENGWCQTEATPPTVLRFSEMRLLVRPATDLVVGFFYVPYMLWRFLVLNPSAAILASALLASIFAYLSVQSQRAITRLRETFATINDDNWDKDVIKARNIISSIKAELGENRTDIAKYCSPGANSGDLEKVIALSTIMNDYENLALGVRHNIMDEEYLHRWMRSALLEDWVTLSPLVTAYRYTRKNPNIYIEFEGLAAAWGIGTSYRTQLPLKKANRSVSIN